jgi:hypothetical protein
VSGYARVALALGLGAGAACGPVGRGDERTIVAFLEAVQAQQLDSLYCLMAGASEASELGADEVDRRAAFERWAHAQYDAYLAGRDRGWVDLDEQGIKLVKLFALGRGTFFTLVARRRVADGVHVVRSQVRFAYDRVDLSRLSPGTTFYVSGAPIGRVHPVTVPDAPREVTLELLSEATVDWTLVREEAAGGCPAGWAVASIEPVEHGVRTAEVRWIF